MFTPYREKNDILLEGSYWKRFNSERMKWSQKLETIV